ncbi:MAG TPA: hypothetical protein VF721_09325 [Pyrinomonadaceae bacterium]|jgi:hypothetical protein
MRIFIFLFLVCLLSAGAFDCPAQKSKKDVLPHVGRFRQDEETGANRSGCDNHPLVFTKGKDDVFFESRGDGLDAFMNLDGHNVKLRLLKTTVYYLDEYGTADAVYEYRYKEIRITVSLRVLSDYTDWIPAKVVIRKNRAARRLNVFVAPQCDAI